jgi:hypothetical protein
MSVSSDFRSLHRKYRSSFLQLLLPALLASPPPPTRLHGAAPVCARLQRARRTTSNLSISACLHRAAWLRLSTPLEGELPGALHLPEVLQGRCRPASPSSSMAVAALPLLHDRHSRLLELLLVPSHTCCQARWQQLLSIAARRRNRHWSASSAGRHCRWPPSSRRPGRWWPWRSSEHLLTLGFTDAVSATRRKKWLHRWMQSGERIRVEACLNPLSPLSRLIYGSS